MHLKGIIDYIFEIKQLFTHLKGMKPKKKNTKYFKKAKVNLAFSTIKASFSPYKGHA